MSTPAATAPESEQQSAECGCAHGHPAGPDRRTVLIGAAIAAGVVTLAACGGDEGGDEGGGGTADGGSGTGPLATVDEIPDGSALVVESADGPVVLVRSGSTVTAVSAVCTHQGCNVRVDEDTLPCPCHGSLFALDGSVLQGPATAPLDAVAVVVADGEVSLA